MGSSGAQLEVAFAPRLSAPIEPFLQGLSPHMVEHFPQWAHEIPGKTFFNVHPNEFSAENTIIYINVFDILHGKKIYLSKKFITESNRI